MDTIRIMTWNKETRRYDVPRVVDCKRITVPGFEDFTIGIHRHLVHCNKWTISEAESGFNLFTDNYAARSQKAAIENLRVRFEMFNMTPALFRKAIDNANKANKRGK